MKSKTSLLSYNIIYFFIVSICLYSCGGGSTGTGGSGSSDFQIRGVLVSTDGQTISGANITLEETGDSTTSDSEGQYSLSSMFPGENAKLLIERGEFSQSIQLSRLSNRAIAEVDLEIDEKRGGIRIVSVVITPIDGTVEGTEEGLLSVFEGQLLGEGGPVRNALITIAAQSAATDQDGSFSIEAQAFGDINVFITLPNDTNFSTILPDIPEEAVLVEVEIQIPPRGGPKDKPTKPKNVELGIMEKRPPKR